MTLDELKQTIEQRTGVPASLLTGETAEEAVAQAKAMLAYKREHEQKRPQTTAEQFSAWAGAEMGLDAPQDTAGAALAEIAEAIRVERGGYPIVHDGGQIDINRLPDPRPAKEQFAGWASQQLAFNPFTDSDGWTPLT